MFVDIILLLLGIGIGYLLGRLSSRWKSLQEGERIDHPGLAPEYHRYNQPPPRLQHDVPCRPDPQYTYLSYRNWPR